MCMLCSLICAEVSLSLLDLGGLELFDYLGGPCFCVILFFVSSLLYVGPGSGARCSVVNLPL